MDKDMFERLFRTTLQVVGAVVAVGATVTVGVGLSVGVGLGEAFGLVCEQAASRLELRTNRQRARFTPSCVLRPRGPPRVAAPRRPRPRRARGRGRT